MTMAAVEAARIEPVQPVHPQREIWRRRAEDEVVMVGHQAVEVEDPLVGEHHVAQKFEEKDAIVVVLVDPLSSISA